MFNVRFITNRHRIASNLHILQCKINNNMYLCDFLIYKSVIKYMIRFVNKKWMCEIYFIYCINQFTKMKFV